MNGICKAIRPWKICAANPRPSRHCSIQAGTVAQARQRLDQGTYTLVNTDLRLPDGNGLAIADRAADLGARTSILSGYVFQLPPGAAVKHKVMTKPIRPSEFVATVQRLIGPAGEA